MASPTVTSRTAYTLATTNTAHAVTMPAATVAGELLIMGFTTGAASGGITTPTGWSIIAAETAVNGGGSSTIIYGKKADGTEGGTTPGVTTVNAVTAAAATFRIAGWGGTLTRDVVAGTPVNAASNAAPDPPSATWGWGTVDSLSLIFNGLSAANTLAWSAEPTGYGSGTTSNAGNFLAKLRTATKSITAQASPEDPSTWTLNGAAPTVVDTVIINAPGVLYFMQLDLKHGDIAQVIGGFQ